MHGVYMPAGVVMGDPGTRFHNGTEKILWQLIVSFHNSCAICIQYANAIGTFFPIPYHFGCNCRIEPIPPGEQAPEEFIDFEKAVEALPRTERSRVLGAENWKLIQAGKVKWTDVVTRSRIRPLHEVIQRARLDEKALVGVGINRRFAREAIAKVRTPAKAAADTAAKAAYQQLKALGLKDQDIVESLKGQIAARVSIVGKPSGPSAVAVKAPPPKPPSPPTPPPKPKPATPKPMAPPPRVQVRPEVPPKGEAIPPKPRAIPEVGGQMRMPKGEAATLAAAKSLIGRDVSPGQIAAIAGAPEGAKVTIRFTKDQYLRQLEVEAHSPEVTLHRVIQAPADSERRATEIYNHYFEIKGEKGTGAGTRIFANQVRAAIDAGFETLRATAERQDSLGYNGYYTWSRLGYDAELPDHILAHLPEELGNARLVSDLMATEAGRAYWKEYGETLEMTFDLRDGSLSRRILDAYLQAKGKK